MNRQARITNLLELWTSGEKRSTDKFFHVVYGEMKRLARDNVHKYCRFGPAVNPTSLLHDAWIKFERADKQSVECTAHFYNAVSQIMRQILFDLIDSNHRVKHGGGLVQTDLSPLIEENARSIDELVGIHLALADLESVDPTLSNTIEMHYFAGLSVEEIAANRGISSRTVKRNLAIARVLLQEALTGVKSISEEP